VDGILPSVLDDARRLAQKGVEAGLPHLGLPSPGEKHSLPGSSVAYWESKIHHIAVTAEGIDTAIDAAANLADFHDWAIQLIDPPTLSGMYSPQARASYRWEAYSLPRWPMSFSIRLSRAAQRIAANLQVTWQVFRSDNNALLAAFSRPYIPRGVLQDIVVTQENAIVRGARPDPATNGILIGLRHKDYYFLPGVRVTCSVTADLGGQRSEIFAGESVVLITDNLDRHRKFVQWGPHVVYFANAGTDNKTWVHNRTSKVHRTALGGRCSMMRERAAAPSRKRPKFTYADNLPYKWEELFQHRHYLCEYCFFGGPDKTKPYPQEDWF
jgi:hypothetical protein